MYSREVHYRAVGCGLPPALLWGESDDATLGPEHYCWCALVLNSSASRTSLEDYWWMGRRRSLRAFIQKVNLLVGRRCIKPIARPGEKNFQQNGYLLCVKNARGTLDVLPKRADTTRGTLHMTWTTIFPLGPGLRSTMARRPRPISTFGPHVREVPVMTGRT